MKQDGPLDDRDEFYPRSFIMPYAVRDDSSGTVNWRDLVRFYSGFSAVERPIYLMPHQEAFLERLRNGTA
jgi:hypothetical protein